MTSAYLLSTLSSSSSMGGLVMPSGLAAVPATPTSFSCVRDRGPGYQSLGPHQPDQLLSRLLDRRVDDRRVELVLGGELDLSRVQTRLDDLRRLGAPPVQAPLELLPRGGRQEHEQGVGHQLTHLAGPLHLDLQQYGVAGGEPVLDRPARRAVPVAGVLRVFQQLALAQHAAELLAVDEEPVEPVDLPGAWGARCRTDRVPDVRVVFAEVGDHRALADACRTGQDGQPGRSAQEAPHIKWLRTSGGSAHHETGPPVANSRSRACR